MSTLWCCIVTIIVLCFIVVSLWLLLRKHSPPNKKLKGGGMKMKGGGPVEELQAAIAILMAYPDGALPETLEDLKELNKANIVFSEWISVVANGSESPENVVEMATILAEMAISSEKENIIVPALSACMKSPYAFYIANTIKDNPTINEFYSHRLETDYLARLYVIITGQESDPGVYEYDILNGANAIRAAYKMSIDLALAELTQHIIDRIYAFVTEGYPHEFYIELVLCLIYMYKCMPEVRDIYDAASTIFVANVNDDLLLIARFIEALCDVYSETLNESIRDDITRYIGPLITPEFMSRYSGIIDFDYIAKIIDLPELTMAIFTEQASALAISLGADPSTINPSTLDPIRIYETASSLVEPTFAP